ncbi:hypothetical protein [Helicobacter sp.]|uniref:hypothetical protein n=1 Tax=Helicobacter sp. TaxID=218 RepID=UPI0025C27E15|nr:hypothetical protein [Helicobacter sp.]MCI5968268.1 hypothetical protein [Helicobacter sp.]MDY2584900.1 hypothetical protein [Helicobacter sp.]
MLGVSSKNLVGVESVMSNTIYSAMHTNFTQGHSKDNIEISAIKTSSKSAYNNNVYFRDPLSNAYVQVGLSDANLSKLQCFWKRFH